MANYDSLRRGIIPKASDRDVHDLVWNCTPYPFVSDRRKIRRSMRRYLKLGGGTVGGAIDAAMDELDHSMSHFFARFPECKQSR